MTAQLNSELEPPKALISAVDPSLLESVQTRSWVSRAAAASHAGFGFLPPRRFRRRGADTRKNLGLKGLAVGVVEIGDHSCTARGILIASHASSMISASPVIGIVPHLRDPKPRGFLNPTHPEPRSKDETPHGVNAAGALSKLLGFDVSKLLA